VCLHTRLFEKLKKNWISKYINLKQIFERLNNFIEKLINKNIVEQVGNENFGINYVNIQGRLEIINFQLKIYELRTQI
jgi:hypothetical protein